MQYTAYNVNLAEKFLGYVTRTSYNRRQRLSCDNSLARIHNSYCRKEHPANACTVCTADNRGNDSCEVSMHCMIATHFITTKTGETATTFHLATKFHLNISITCAAEHVVVSLTFSARPLNFLLVLRVRIFLREGPLNHRACCVHTGS
jgi:hypothetical protein